MKIRNKFIFSIVCLFSCSFILLGFAGCNDSDPNAKKVEYDNEYDFEYDREFEGEYDEYMNIDGVLDEDVWNDAQHKWLTFSENGATVSYTTYFTKKGLYIASKAEDNKTLFDIVNDAIDDTLMNTTRLYVLYDDYGKLTLKNTEDMLLDLLIDSETGQSYDYTSSINDQTYNQVKLAYDNKETGKREVFIAKDTKNINNWGVLQYFEKLQSPQGASAKADALLKLYNAKTRNLKISGAFGDTRVRAGCSVVVKLDLGDVSIQNFMLVEKVKHTFNNDLHTMDITLRGGEFVA